MILLVDSEGPDQNARMCRLIWAFAVHLCPKTHICMMQPIYEIFSRKKKTVEKISKQ